MSTQIPKAVDYFNGDINQAVIAVQKATGIEISPEWWAKNVGNDGATQKILERFDAAYERDFGAQITAGQ